MAMLGRVFGWCAAASSPSPCPSGGSPGMEMDRLRRFLGVGGLLLLGAAGVVRAAEARDAGARPWLIVNEDNDHYFKGPSARMNEADLAAYVDDVCRGPVTHFFMCPSGQRASFDSKTWEPIWKGLDEPEERGAVSNRWCVNAKILHDRGIDPYAVWTKRCRARGVSPWITVRMNDTHHMKTVPNYFRNTTFCRTRADLWIRPDGRGWADCSLDFAQKDVRDYTMAHIRELAERYDVDGIELDWMRFGHHLRPDRVREDAHHLTEFTRGVRRFLDGVGDARGRRIRLGVRVCRDPDLALTRQGLAVEAWAKEGLVDLVVPHSFYLADAGIAVAKWIDRIRAANPAVKVIPGIDHVHAKAGKTTAMTAANIRWVAERFYAEGATGIYLFNVPYLGSFCADERAGAADTAAEIYAEGLAPETIRTRPREPIEIRHDFP
ncbi:MAG: hypothetical protein ACI4Q3_01160 [Kiritimatiellia bacterium]